MRVGESVFWREKIHFAAPKPSDLATLMDGMFAAHRRMEAAKLQPIVHAVTIAFGFVYMHPFEDGNGRIHRFLIHNILARSGFTPPGVIFPVSAAMLQDKEAYDAALEDFSGLLLPFVQYTLDYQGRMTVQNETAPRLHKLHIFPLLSPRPDAWTAAGDALLGTAKDNEREAYSWRRASTGSMLAARNAG